MTKMRDAVIRALGRVNAKQHTGGQLGNWPWCAVCKTPVRAYHKEKVGHARYAIHVRCHLPCKCTNGVALVLSNGEKGIEQRGSNALVCPKCGAHAVEATRYLEEPAGGWSEDRITAQIKFLHFFDEGADWHRIRSER